MSKKSKVLEEIYNICVQKNDFVFHNDLVKDISKKHEFGNPFDATKIDNKSKLPKILIDNDMAPIHLGSGSHKYIKGIDKVFHHFEPIQETIEWQYNKSLLNLLNTSESNILSIANNQRILHKFVFNKDNELNDVDIIKRPKTYFPHRTKTSFSYNFGPDIKIDLSSIQIEIDLTIEFQGVVSIFEAKNGKPTNFNIYQLYHPFLYYYMAKQIPEIDGKIKEIICVYLVRRSIKKVQHLNLWAYTFENPLDITSIKFLKSRCYKLIQ
jgi:hypothetical protein